MQAAIPHERSVNVGVVKMCNFGGEQQALLLLLNCRVSEEMVSLLKENILMKWRAGPTPVAVGSAPSGGLECHRFVQLHKH